MLVVSSFATLAPGVEALPVLVVCANAGEATTSAAIIIPGIVSFIEASIVELLINSKQDEPFHEQTFREGSTRRQCFGNLQMPEKYRRPHNHERRRTIADMQEQWRAERGALITVRRFNAVLSTKGTAWFWPKIAAALTSKHHWLIIACDACDTVVDLDLRVKPRDPEASIRVALRGICCPRCNGHGRPRIIALARQPS
jgi:hypothetical protein